jgi:integrase
MRPNLPRYVQPIRAKGTVYLYFRRHGQRWRLPGRPGDAEFNARYLELLGQTNSNPDSRCIGEGSIAALIRDYRASDEFLALKAKTQNDYGRMLDRFAPIDRHSAEAIRRKHIRELRKGLAGKTRTQKLFTQVASALFNFGIDNEYCSLNPAARMKRIGKAKSYVAWSDAQCAAFEAWRPARHLMTAYMIARFAGQRRGDVLKMARTCYDGSCIEVRQEKTDESLVIPAHRRLKTYLDQLPKDSLLFVVDAKGQPIDETTFSKEFRAALDCAGLNQLHFHGLRHSAGRALAEAGCSSHEIQAITGHRTLQMVEHYTKAARQKRLASSAIAKLEGTGTEQESGKPDEGSGKR